MSWLTGVRLAPRRLGAVLFVLCLVSQLLPIGAWPAGEQAVLLKGGTLQDGRVVGNKDCEGGNCR